MPIAFVMSGAANYGPLQVGALQTLLEHGVRPDLLIGTSAGAMNAAYLAIDPTPDGARRLADLWNTAARDLLSRSDRLAIVWRLLTNRDGVMSNEPLRRYVERTMPPGVTRYADLKVPAYAVAVRLDSGEIRCFGDNPDDRLLDGLMANTAIPGFYPPWRCDGVEYIDGGVVAYLPIRLAVQRGATEIYALNVSAGGLVKRARGTLAIAGRAIDLLIQRQGSHEIELHLAVPGVVVHPLALQLRRDVAFWDFRHADEMAQVGRDIADAYLRDRSTHRRHRSGLRIWLARRPHARVRLRTPTRWLARRRRLEARRS